MFRTYRGQSEFVHWIGRFEIAQKRLLASWSDLLDISDLPETGTPAFTAALTDEQRLHYNGIVSDEDKLAYQQTLREQTITNRRTRHAQQFPLSDNLIVTDFSSPSRPQRATTWAFCLVNEHPSDSNASVYLSPSETAVLGTFCRFSHRCCRPKHHAPQAVQLLRPSTRVETEEGEYGFLGLRWRDGWRKVSQVCTPRTSSGFLSAKGFITILLVSSPQNRLYTENSLQKNNYLVKSMIEKSVYFYKNRQIFPGTGGVVVW